MRWKPEEKKGRSEKKKKKFSWSQVGGKKRELERENRFMEGEGSTCSEKGGGGRYIFWEGPK